MDLDNPFLVQLDNAKAYDTAISDPLLFKLADCLKPTIATFDLLSVML